MNTTVDQARALVQRYPALKLIPVPYGTKVPVLKGWQDLRLTEADVPAYFDGRPMNIGILTGKPSGGWTDADLDWPEAVAAARFFLPPTDCRFGRRSKRNSHWQYLTDPCPAYLKLSDPAVTGDEKNCILEIRTDGHQTIAPGSLNPSDGGELVEFEPDGRGEPARVDATELIAAAKRTAGCALLARHWPKGSRQDAALYVAGGLLKGGWTTEDAAHFIEAVAIVAGDEEVSRRLEVVVPTGRKLAAGSQVAG